MHVARSEFGTDPTAPADLTAQTDLTSQTELGIDEAGRGPVLGPMVLAGLQVQARDLARLRRLKIQDSKLFGSGAKGRKEREKLCKILKEDFPHEIRIISPQTIDQFVSAGPGLNRLEQSEAQKIIQALPSDRVVLDGQNLFKPLLGPGIQAFNRADQDYLSVAGASILAKVTRDQALEELLSPFRGDFGEIGGGGYPNGATLKFILWYAQRFGELPAFYRKSYQWKALQENYCSLL